MNINNAHLVNVIRSHFETQGNRSATAAVAEEAVKFADMLEKAMAEEKGAEQKQQNLTDAERIDLYVNRVLDRTPVEIIKPTPEYMRNAYGMFEERKCARCGKSLPNGYQYTMCDECRTTRRK